MKVAHSKAVMFHSITKTGFESYVKVAHSKAKSKLNILGIGLRAM